MLALPIVALWLKKMEIVTNQTHYTAMPLEPWIGSMQIMEKMNSSATRFSEIPVSLFFLIQVTISLFDISLINLLIIYRYKYTELFICLHKDLVKKKRMHHNVLIYRLFLWLIRLWTWFNLFCLISRLWKLQVWLVGMLWKKNK